MYSELIGNYKKYRIKSLYDNILTINSPSNQIRILKNNLKETGMVLGQLFIPLLETLLPMLNALTLVVKDLLVSFANFAGIEINFEAFGEGFIADEDIPDMEESLDGAVTSLEELKKQIMGFDEVNPLDSISDSFDSIADGIDLTTEILTKTEEYEKVWNEAYGTMQETASKFANTIEGKFSGVSSAISNLGQALQSFDGLEFLGEGFAEGFMNVIDFLVNDVGATAINTFASRLEDLGIVFNKLDDEQIKNIGKAIGEITAAILVYKVGSTALTAGLNLLGLLMQYKSLGSFTVGVTFAIVGFEIGTKINEWLTGEKTENFSIWDFFGDVGWAIKNGTFIQNLGDAIEELRGQISSKLGGLKDSFTLGQDAGKAIRDFVGKIKTALWELPTWIGASFKSEIGSKIRTAIDFGTAIKESFDAGLEGVKEAWNTFARWLNDKLTWEIEPIKIKGVKIFDGATINLGKIPTFQTGGFPEDGLFMANHNELVGQFSNGKTAVANNEQIIQGIQQGVYSAMMSALSNNATNGNIDIYIDGQKVFRAVQKQANNYTMQTGRSPFLA